MRDRGNRWQRLAAKPERADRGEIAGAPDLAGRVAFDRQPRIVRLHAFAVVFDADLLLSPELGVDLHAACAGVDGVFDELFDDRRRSLDHLAGGALVRPLGGATGALAQP